jgi:hypothetical protein
MMAGFFSKAGGSTKASCSQETINKAPKLIYMNRLKCDFMRDIDKIEIFII